jgi:hypothetical protein
MANNFDKNRNGISLGNLPSAPANPLNGDLYYDTTLQQFQKYENGAWSGMGSGTFAPSSIFLEQGQNSSTVTRSYIFVRESVGTGITYTSDTTNGDFFTINSPGLYAIDVADTASTTMAIGVTLNANNTTAIQSLTYATGRRSINDAAATSDAFGCTAHVRCVASDVIRIQASSLNPGNNNNPRTYVHIQKIAN